MIPNDSGGGAPNLRLHQPKCYAQSVALGECVKPDERGKYPLVRSGPYLMAKFKLTMT